MPRAATSVATRICTWPWRSAIRRRLRRPWLRAPCSATALKPSCCRSLARPSHSTCVLANTIAWLMLVSRSQWSSSLRLCWLLSAQYSDCLMLACFSCGLSMVMRCGSRMTRWASCWMRGAKVALNIMVCWRSMVSWLTSARSSAKPRSSMRSASSTTRNLTWSSLSCCERCRSSRRPGVATTRSAFCSLAICNW
ncbi:hypothetical protein FQZ97_861780 [compost metagenome]